MDPRRDPENLREHLLGGRGLISRSLQRLAEVARIPAPRESSGSYVPAQNGSARKLVLGDGSDAPILELCEQLRAWLGLDPIDFTPYLVRWAVADHDIASMLLGNVREVVASWTRGRNHVPEKHTDALLALVGILQAWLGSDCEHLFIPRVDPKTKRPYRQCARCKFSFEEEDWIFYQANERFAFPPSRCEWCGAPMTQSAHGPARLVCSEACKKARQRDAG